MVSLVDGCCVPLLEPANGNSNNMSCHFLWWFPSAVRDASDDFRVYALDTIIDLDPKQATSHRIAGLIPVRPAIEVLRNAEDLFLLEEMLAYGLRGRCTRRFLPWVSPLLSSRGKASSFFAFSFLQVSAAGLLGLGAIYVLGLSG